MLGFILGSISPLMELLELEKGRFESIVLSDLVHVIKILEVPSRLELRFQLGVTNILLGLKHLGPPPDPFHLRDPNLNLHPTALTRLTLTMSHQPDLNTASPREHEVVFLLHGSNFFWIPK